MALYVMADKQEELPEQIRQTAREQGGKFIADLGPLSVSDDRAIKSAVVEERRARKIQAEKLAEFGWKLKDDASGWGAEGLDANDGRDAIDKVRTGQFKSSKEIDDHKAVIQTKYEKDRKEWDRTTATLRQQLQETLVDREAMLAIQNSGGNLRLLLPVVRSAAKTEVDANGRLVVSLHDDDGKAMLTQKSGSTEPMGFAEFVEGLKRQAEFKPAFSGTGSGGSGSTSQHGGSARAGNNGSNLVNLSSTELIQRANDRAAAGMR